MRQFQTNLSVPDEFVRLKHVTSTRHLDKKEIAGFFGGFFAFLGF